MYKSKRITILVTSILLVYLLVIPFASCQQQHELVPPEIPDGWSLYNEKRAGICFYYPSEWGEVIDYIDYFQELTTSGEPEELSREEEERIEDFRSAIEDSGKYLAFSNLDMDFGAHIRITSVEQMQSFVSYCNDRFYTLYPPDSGSTSSQITYIPLFGYFGGNFIGVQDLDLEEQLSPVFRAIYLREQFPRTIWAIADLPEDASPEDLRDTALPVFFLFANAIRHFDILSEGSPGQVGGLLRTTHGQIATNDGMLRGVTESGSEGFDTGGRDYWDCILTTSDGDRLVYISFTVYSGYDLGNEELLYEQQTKFIEFTSTITLLE